MLEPDATSVIADVLIFNTNNLASGNHTPYTRVNFEPSPSDVAVNCLFFASLSTSLVAALAAVVARQWVADYDATITRGGSSPEERAKSRQFRYDGIVWWKMSEVISALPLLLYCSDFLFFGGLILWMWEIHHSVGVVVAAGAVTALLFYGVSTILAVAFVSAPFRTPLTRLVYEATHLSLSLSYPLLGSLHIPFISAWLNGRDPKRPLYHKRDDREVSRRHELAMEALVWVAKRISISQVSYDRLLLLASELPKLGLRDLSSPVFKEAPWTSIFDLLAWRNLKNDINRNVDKKETDAVAVLIQCYRIPVIYEIVRPGKSEYIWDDEEDEYWTQYCNIVEYLWSPRSHLTKPNSLFLLLRDIPLPSDFIIDELQLTIWLSRWRNSQQQPPKALDVRLARQSITSLELNSSSISTSRQTHSSNEWNLWFNRDYKSLYTAIMTRMAPFLINGEVKLPPGFLDVLRWRFESILVVGDSLELESCLLFPFNYHKALQNSSNEHSSIHHAFTLLLARNLDSFSGANKTRRVKELITMIWVGAKESPYYGRLTLDVASQPRGMEQFFEANKENPMEWIAYTDTMPGIHEILRHLGAALAKQPDIGPLWRLVHFHNPDSHFLEALEAFDRLILRGVTPTQHRTLVDLICQDIELGPPESFLGWNGLDQLRRLAKLQDPCLQVLAKYIGP
jgi:hypothetical protein